MAYTNSLTYAQFRSALAARLDDYSKIFWTDDELKAWTLEALRTWNAYAWFYRDRDTFSTANNQTWYDLRSVLSGSTLAPSITDRNIINALQYHLLEPPTTNWTLNTPAMTEMFTASDLTSAVQNRRNQLLVESGVIQSNNTLAITANASGRFSLNDTTIDIRRAAFLRNSVYTSLKRTDDMSVNGWRATALTTPADPPVSYATILTQPVQVQLYPPPSQNGTLDMLSVLNLANLDPTTGVLLNIPDDLAFVVKWGAMADLLNRDGQARDPLRAEYAQKRWADGLLVAQMLPSITAAYIAGSPVILGDVYNADGFRAGWQNATHAQPSQMLMSNWNIVGFSPTPNGTYTITCDLLRNMVVPASDSDVLQIGKEITDVLLDYAEHLACFKMGGEEFQMSMPCYERFVRAAMMWNDRLRAQAMHFKWLFDRQDVEEKQNARKVAAD